MAYKVEIDKKAEKDFDSLDNSIRIKIDNYLKKLANAENPKVYGKQLTGNLAGYWSYRVVNYRIIADIQDDKLVVYVISILTLNLTHNF